MDDLVSGVSMTVANDVKTFEFSEASKRAVEKGELNWISSRPADICAGDSCIGVSWPMFDSRLAGTVLQDLETGVTGMHL